MATALIVGGSRPGIGQALTERFRAEGDEVVATFQLADETSTEYRTSRPDVTWVEVDHENTRELISLLNTQSPEKVVVAEFLFLMEDSKEFNIDNWERSVAVNLTLPKAIGFLAISAWKSCSSVVCITSTEAFVGSFGAHSYAATKAATHNLIKSLANVSAPIRFNAVAAGWIGGVMDTDEVFNRSRAITPLGRLGAATEVAAAAHFLSSDEASFITGTVLVADGGYSGVDSVSKFEYQTEFGVNEG